MLPTAKFLIESRKLLKKSVSNKYLYMYFLCQCLFVFFHEGYNIQLLDPAYLDTIYMTLRTTFK